MSLCWSSLMTSIRLGFHALHVSALELQLSWPSMHSFNQDIARLQANSDLVSFSTARKLGLKYTSRATGTLKSQISLSTQKERR